MPRKAMTQEEKLAKAEAKKAERQAKKQAELEALRQAWAAERLKKQEEFQAALTADERESLKFLEPSGYRPDFNGVDQPYWNDHFLGDLARQLKTRGYLSPIQLGILVKRLLRDRETAELAQRFKWAELAEGDKVMLLADVQQVNQEQGDNGTYWRVRVIAQGKRPFQFKTTSQKIVDRAVEMLKNGEKATIEAKVKWVSPDKRITVLTSRGMKFGGLMD